MFSAAATIRQPWSSRTAVCWPSVAAHSMPRIDHHEHRNAGRLRHDHALRRRSRVVEAQDGTLVLAGGVTGASTVTIDVNAALLVTGRLQGSLVNNGTLIVQGGLLDVAADVTGPAASLSKVALSAAVPRLNSPARATPRSALTATTLSLAWLRRLASPARSRTSALATPSTLTASSATARRWSAIRSRSRTTAALSSAWP